MPPSADKRQGIRYWLSRLSPLGGEASQLLPGKWGAKGVEGGWEHVDPQLLSPTGQTMGQEWHQVSRGPNYDVRWTLSWAQSQCSPLTTLTPSPILQTGILRLRETICLMSYHQEVEELAANPDLAVF